MRHLTQGHPDIIFQGSSERLQTQDSLDHKGHPYQPLPWIEHIEKKKKKGTHTRGTPTNIADLTAASRISDARAVLCVVERRLSAETGVRRETW